MTKTVEYRVRPVTRYIVTKFAAEEIAPGCGAVGSSVIGEFENQKRAVLVSEALSRQDGHPVKWEPMDEQPTALPGGPYVPGDYVAHEAVFAHEDAVARAI